MIKERYDINDYLLCVGEVRPYKNIENIFRALELWSDGPQLAISGKITGEHKAKLENLAQFLENRKPNYLAGLCP